MRESKNPPISSPDRPGEPPSQHSEAEASHACEPGVQPPLFDVVLRPSVMEATKSSVGLAPARHNLGGVAGLAARTAHGAQGVASGRVGRTPASVAATLTRALAGVDMRLVGLLVQSSAEFIAAEIRLEIALLARLHQTIVGQTAQMQHDAVLLDSLAEFADTVTQTVADLEAGGLRGLDRWLDFVRDLVGEQAAFGGTPTAIKQTLRATRANLAPLREAEKTAGTLSPEALQQLVTWRQQTAATYVQLAAELEAMCPKQHFTWLDRIADATPA